jgi:hypothetical protein
MGRGFRAVRLALQKAGAELARMWLGLLGLVMLVAFQAVGFVACAALWFGLALLFRDGWVGAVASGLLAFGFGVFLSVYVWEPHVKPAVMEATTILERLSPSKFWKPR